MSASVKRLKGEFLDDSLPKIDEIKIRVENTDSIEVLKLVIFSYIGTGNYARATGDISFCDETGEEDYGDNITLSTGAQTLYFKGTDGYVFVGNKGNAGGIAFYSEKTKMDINELSYVSYNRTNIYSVNCRDLNSIYGDISELVLAKDVADVLYFYNCTLLTGEVGNILKQGKSVSTLNINFSNVRLDLEALSHQSDIKVSMYCDGVYGDIKYAVYNKKKISGTQNIEFNVNAGSYLNIHGSIEELVSLGVSFMGAGSIKLAHLKQMPNVTYQGVSVVESSAISSDSPILSWDAQGNISWS